MKPPRGPRIPLGEHSNEDEEHGSIPTFDPEDPDLQEELELACLDAIRGDPPSEAVARRLEHAVRRALRPYGLDNATVRATSDRTGTQVVILLPPEIPHVREFVLTVG